MNVWRARDICQPGDPQCLWLTTQKKRFFERSTVPQQVMAIHRDPRCTFAQRSLPQLPSLRFPHILPSGGWWQSSSRRAAQAPGATQSRPRCCTRSPSCRPSSACRRRSAAAGAEGSPPSPTTAEGLGLGRDKRWVVSSRLLDCILFAAIPSPATKRRRLSGGAQSSCACASAKGGCLLRLPPRGASL